MSWNARSHSKSDRHLCACGRSALYRQPGWGQYVWRQDHQLCQQCYRSERNRDRATRLRSTRRVPRWDVRARTAAAADCRVAVLGFGPEASGS